MKKISLFVHCFPPAKGGVELLAEKIKQMLEGRYEVHIFTGRGLTLDSYKSFSNFTHIKYLNVHRLELDFFKQRLANKLLNKIIFKIPLFSPFYFGPILKYTEEDRKIINSSDVIIGFAMPTKTFYDSFYFAKKYNKKLILHPTYHNVSYYNNCSLFQKSFDYADKIIYQTELEKTGLLINYHIKLNKLAKLAICPFSKKEIERQNININKKIEMILNNFKNKKITIGYVGQINQRKNLQLIKRFLDEYYQKFRMSGYEMKVNLSGVRTNTSKIIEKTFLNYIQDKVVSLNYNFKNKKQVFNDIDIFINPSMEESLGIVNFEAIFYGLPLIINKKSAFASEYNNNNFYLIESPKEIYFSINTIIQSKTIENDIRKNLHLLENSSLEEYKKRLIDIIEDCQ